MTKIWSVKDAADDLADIREFLKRSSVSEGSRCPLCLAAGTMDRFAHKPTVDFIFDGKRQFSGEVIDPDVWRAGVFQARESEQVFVDDMITICNLCGWWRVVRVTDRSRAVDFGQEDGGVLRSYHGSVGLLKKFEEADFSPAIDRARKEILAKWATLKTDIDPYLLEHIVASELRNMGYDAHATARTNDGGIDVIANDQRGVTFGIQVKRTKNTISVEQIRAFIGALVLSSTDIGLFVTTSKFSPEAEGASKKAERMEYRIELVDGQRFLESIEINQRNIYTSGQELLKYYQHHLKALVLEQDLGDDPDCTIENTIV